VARQAGKKHAANAAIANTTNADPNASGSRGLTLYKRLPSSASIQAPPSRQDHTAGRQRQATPHHQPQQIGGVGASAMRSPNSRVLCDTA